MKRDLSIILCILMIFSLCTYNVKANDNDTDDESKTDEVFDTSEVEKQDEVTSDDIEETSMFDEADAKEEILIEDSSEYEIGLSSLEEQEAKEVEKTYVAQIGDISYETLQEAIDASLSGDTITIIEDIAFKLIKNDDGTYGGQGYDGLYTSAGNSCSVVGSKGCFPRYTLNTIENKDITINLNNKKLSIDCDFGAYIFMFDVRNNANVTFSGNGIIDGNDPVGSSFNCPYLINIYSNSEVSIKDGEYYSAFTVQVYNGKLNIEGGHFDLDDTLKDVGKKYNTDYYYTYLINCIDAPYKKGEALVNITGGTFVKFNPANNKAEGANTNFVSEGYEVTSETKENSEVWYTVSANKDALKEALDIYTSMGDLSSYCKESRNAYITAYNEALNIYNNISSTSKEVSNAVDLLNSAHDALVLKELIHIDSKEATCTSEGNIEYYECIKCHTKYSDINGTIEITGSVIINALGHDYTKTEAKEATISSTGNIEYYTCLRCKKLFIKENDNYLETTLDKVTISKVDDTDLISAVSTYEGTIDSYKNGYCKSTIEAYTNAYNNAKEVINNIDSNQNQVTEALDAINKAKNNITKHNLVKHEGYSETCTTDGQKTYYECVAVCKKLFLDENATKEITLDDTIIKAHGHLYQTISAKEPTIGLTGNIEYYRCGNCNKLFIKENDNYLETTLDKVTLPKVDTTALDKMLSETISDLNKYTKQTADDYNTSLANAKKVRNNDDSTKEDVNKAINNLKEAIDNLKEKTVADTPIFSLNEGTYTSAQDLTINSGEGGNKVVIRVNDKEITSQTIKLTGIIGEKIEYNISAYTIGDDNHLNSEEITLKYIIDIVKGKIEDTNPATDDSTKALEPKSSEIDSSIIELDEIEKEAIDQGRDIEVILSVKEAENKEEIKKTEDILNENYSLNKVSIIDISLSLNILGEDISRTINNTNKAISISVKINQEYINTNKDIERTYQVIRIHTEEDGSISTKIIDGSFNFDTKTFTFETDKFSTYALVYKDSKKETNNINPVKTCEDAIGRNWTWSEKSKTCVYKVSVTSSK